MKQDAVLFSEQLVNVLSSENVIRDPDVLREYSRDQSFVPPRMPMCVLKPGTSRRSKT